MRKKYGRVKDKPKAGGKDFLQIIFRKYFSYGHEQKGNILNMSLPCPIPSCRFRTFSKIFDGYSDELKIVYWQVKINTLQL